MPLRQYPGITANTADELACLLESVASGRLLKCPTLESRQLFQCRYVEAGAISIFDLNSTFSSEFRFEPVDYHRFVFHGRGPFEVAMDAAHVTGKTGTNYYIAPGSALRERHPLGYQSVALRVDKKALEDKARIFFDYSGDAAFEMRSDALPDREFNEHVRGNLMRLLYELRDIRITLHRPFLEEGTSYLMTRLLLHCRHSFSKLHERRPIGAGQNRITRVVDYIHANWAKPLCIDTLCLVAAVSAKTLNADFVKYRGITPARYIKRLRLEEARKILLSDLGASVMETAIRCGFSSLGHFARSYAEEFGHLPSKGRTRKL